MKKEELNHHTPLFFIKSMTNNNELCKQYFEVLSSDTMEEALVIRKLVYTTDFELYKDYTIIKEQGNKRLVETWFSIKMKTLQSVITALLELYS